MHPRLSSLFPYPFERLNALQAGVVPPPELPRIALHIGEPKHPPPALVLAALTANLAELGAYPVAAGTPAFREAVAGWLERRYGVGATLDAERMILPVNGTREALFAFVQAVLDPRGKPGNSGKPLVLMPNPFYQIYEGAALLAGAEPVYLDTDPAHGHLPDLDAVDAATWSRCQVLFLCSPGNPSGAVAPLAWMQAALALAERHDFIIAADECYADIYLDESNPPPGFLQAAAAMGNTACRRLVVFHSLSKRSSVPGLRSGFVAGDPTLLGPFRLYRTYHGCAMPGHVLAASAAAWGDDAHGVANRALYRAKFAAVVPLLREVMPVEWPEAGFYLWLDVAQGRRDAHGRAPEGIDTAWTRELFAQQNVTSLPGEYLARPGADGGHPGRGRVRLSLVAPLAECIAAAQRIARFHPAFLRSLADRISA
ncbi:MAG: succinyldiaminopimelate transaminase [Gammaproteobacteria bacterium]